MAAILFMDNKDIRLRILEKLDKENRSTAEFIANDFLQTLHSDLGTIIRAVLDLVEDGYIKQSPPSDIGAIDTSQLKSSDRLLDRSDTPTIRLFITLRGKQFLLESENLKRTSWNLRNEWWVRLSYLTAGALIVVGVNWLTSSDDYERHKRQQFRHIKKDTVRHIRQQIYNDSASDK